MIELINKTDYQFIDISSELRRQYYFPGKVIVVIENPLYLSVSEGEGHRILDAQGDSHYIKSTWVAISWKAKEGQPHFVK